MLTFTLRIKPANGRSLCGSDEEQDIEWHVRTPPPREAYEDADLQVLSVVADGAELDHIKEEFANLPYRKEGMRGTHRTNVWRGEMARFIWDNL